jgi:hypothetical protein
MNEPSAQPSNEPALPPLIATPPGRYRHYKGGLYEVVGTVRHSETLEPMTLYRALYGERGLWVRPAGMFEETVAVDVNGRPYRGPRFTRMSD